MNADYLSLLPAQPRLREFHEMCAAAGAKVPPFDEWIDSISSYEAKTTGEIISVNYLRDKMLDEPV